MRRHPAFAQIQTLRHKPALGAALRGLGMTTAFDQPHGSADFGRMAPHRSTITLHLRGDP